MIDSTADLMIKRSMNVSFSRAAAEKILSDRDRQSRLLETPLSPRLLYFQRSYSEWRDGSVTEHGSGFVLSFVKAEEANDPGYLPVDNQGCRVLIGPAEFFGTGEHFIDWIDQAFRLAR